MLIGAHVMIQSRDDKADMAFFTDVLKLKSVDAGDGFLIFGLPQTDLAVHESEQNGGHQLYFMCDDIAAFAADMKSRGIACTAPADRGWGVICEITLPGGGALSVYQPRHARPD
jgi:hypothetical protein